jgi:hypothetical protein
MLAWAGYENSLRKAISGVQDPGDCRTRVPSAEPQDHLRADDRRMVRRAISATEADHKTECQGEEADASHDTE